MGINTELKVFLSHPRNMRVLLLANLLYAFVSPIVDLFVVAYVMRTSNDVRLVMSYSVAMFTGMPFTFLINGLLLRFLPIKHLFCFGILLSPVAMAIIMALPNLEIGGLILTGLLMGVSFGIYWANRDILTLDCTDDENRNYYYSMNTVFGTSCGMLVPISAGWFISCVALYGWFGGNRPTAYHILTGIAFLLSLISSVVICQGTFNNPAPTRFMYFRYHPMWYRVLWMSALRGLSQGFTTAAPAMLVMMLMGGQEGVLGTLQTCGTLVTVIGMYLIGRLGRTEHRLGLLLAGLLLYLFATVSNAVLFSAVGVIVYTFFQMLGGPLIENTVLQVQMRAINVLSQKENRNFLAYLFSCEFGLWAGRLFGGLLFIAVASVSQIAALRYVLVVIASMQLGAYLLSKTILADCHRFSQEAAMKTGVPSLETI